MAERKPQRLTPKQEKFAQLYVELGNASEAYRQAYPRSQKWTDKTVWSKASKQLYEDLVLARVNQLKEKAAERHEETVDSLVKQLNDALNLAIEIKNPGVMTKAVMDKAKLLGLVIDKKDLSVSVSLADMVAELEE